jgi:two-component system, sensor histidine kinase YcbA
VRKYLLTIFAMLLAVPLAGELKFYPFSGSFRVSFGTPVFFFFLLWVQRINLIFFGALVGLSVTTFRIFLDWAGFVTDFNWNISLTNHFPVFFYYFTYASLFHLTGVKNNFRHPLKIGFLGVGIEILSSFIELSFRILSTGGDIDTTIILRIIVIAFIRSFFVLGFFSILMLRQAHMAEEQQRKRNEQMLLLVSSLYEESVHLKKSMQSCEDVTRDCYELYRSLKAQNNPNQTVALKLAGQIHEVKKDTQRIYAALADMIEDKNISDYMDIEELCNTAIKSNRKYSSLLGKTINFILTIEGNHPKYPTYITLSLINNLVANAVEAIKDSGVIQIKVQRKEHYVILSIDDNGSGVPERSRELIFQHGFTTKFDLSGKPSTGIGLSYVKKFVEELGGKISLEAKPEEKGALFILELPIDSLLKKGLR